MKKVLFTALAVMAFSGVAMAENKIVKKEVSKTVVMTYGGEATPCQNAMLDVYERAVGSGPDNIGLLNELLSYCD